jgi:Fur family ferric uptake transcriptional regulator
MENINEYYIERLSRQGIKPTSVRILILKTILKRNEVFSISDMEDKLQTVDKSTIFRTLLLFQQNNLVHTIDDGSGALKYAVCDEGCDCSAEYRHVHFYCIKCKKAFCLRKTPIPVVDLPEGFSPKNINYVIKGICASCK